jgi:S1-C subfamily serine protease
VNRETDPARSPMSRTIGVLLAGLLLASSHAHADRSATIERVKASVVAVGTLERARAPAFQFRGTGFAIGDGGLIVTNAHVVSGELDAVKIETLAILLPSSRGDDKGPADIREARPLAVDPGSDLAVLRIEGKPLPALKLQEADDVREGREVLFTGFPIGAVLGPYPATHRGMVAAITPIAMPQARAGALNARTIHKLTSGAFPVFQLDATAYPGNSGSPVYDPESGDVVGIVNMVLVKATKESALTQPSGITYAVPASHLRKLLKDVR